MIAYTLRCQNGHEFEGWFRDSAAFDEQSEQRPVELSRPAIPPRSKKPSWRRRSAAPRRSCAPRPDAKQMRQFVTGLRKYVQENAEYVGPNFAEEARKIHYGETPERHIYGEATPEGSPGTGRRRRRRRAAAAGPGWGQLTRPQTRCEASDRRLRRDHHVVDVHIGRELPIPGQRIEGNTLCFQDG